MRGTSALLRWSSDLADCRLEAVLNVLTGGQHQSHREGDAGILKGEYGHTRCRSTRHYRRVLDRSRGHHLLRRRTC